MRFQIITNNPLVREKYEAELNIRYLEVTYEEVLLEAQKLCRQGYKLLTHPLSGSVKPNETPYKSIMISLKPGEVDAESLNIMEKALVTYRKFPKLDVVWREKTLEDFQLIDYTLITSALGSV